jgi:hypothetical protein
VDQEVHDGATVDVAPATQLAIPSHCLHEAQSRFGWIFGQPLDYPLAGELNSLLPI